MRWTPRIAAALVVAGVLFALSPFVAVYRLANAVEARDVAALRARVNFRAVSVSLSRQLVASYVDAYERDLAATSRDLAMGAGVALADPVVSQLVTPEVFVQVLARGWPEAALGAPDQAAPGAGGLRLDSWREVAALMATAEMHGFRRLLVSYPADAPRGRRFRLHLRLSGFTWRVIAVDLPDELKRRLADEIRRRAERGGPLRPPPPVTR